MPTSRRRRFVTETPPVEAALSQLRNELGSDRIDLSAIVVLGAETSLDFRSEWLVAPASR